MSEFKRGDKVKLRDDITIKQLKDNHWYGCRESILEALESDEYVFEVYKEHPFEENMVIVKDAFYDLLPKELLEKVEKEHTFEFGLDIDYVGEKLEWYEGRRIEIELHKKAKELLIMFGKKTKENE